MVIPVWILKRYRILVICVANIAYNFFLAISSDHVAYGVGVHFAKMSLFPVPAVHLSKKNFRTIKLNMFFNFLTVRLQILLVSDHL